MTVAWDHCPERFLRSVNEALQGSKLVDFGRGNGPILLATFVDCIPLVFCGKPTYVSDHSWQVDSVQEQPLGLVAVGGSLE